MTDRDHLLITVAPPVPSDTQVIDVFSPELATLTRRALGRLAQQVGADDTLFQRCAID